MLRQDYRYHCYLVQYYASMTQDLVVRMRLLILRQRIKAKMQLNFITLTTVATRVPNLVESSTYLMEHYRAFC